MKPLTTDHPPYFDRYVSLVKHDDLLKALQETRSEVLRLIQSIPADLEGYAYAEGKWTIKEVILHCMDTERVFSYRALSFARGERQKMLPFEENDYAANSHANSRSLSNLAEELKAVSEATITMFASFSPEVLALSGENASGRTTVNSMGFMVAGHWIHHMNVIRERYLK
jgi:uncharacterized damage-inducible protein DinB